MKSEAEIRCLIEECNEVLDAHDGILVDANAKLCPLRYGCCSECNFADGLSWVLGEYELPRERGGEG